MAPGDGYHGAMSDTDDSNPYSVVPPSSQCHAPPRAAPAPRSTDSVGEQSSKPRRGARNKAAASGDGSAPANAQKAATMSSQYRGVSWHGPSKQWRATIFASARAPLTAACALIRVGPMCSRVALPESVKVGTATECGMRFDQLQVQNTPPRSVCPPLAPGMPLAR